jgi:GNAT superfamily N-acetyltransferase
MKEGKDCMLFQLGKNDYKRVRPLFAGLAYQLTTQAVIDGMNPGTIWVDDVARPRTAFMASPEGYFLAGYEHNDAFNRDLNELILGNILPDEKSAQFDDVLVVVCHPDAWERKFDVVWASRPPIKRQRMHYVFQEKQVKRGASAPDGMTVERIDEHLLSRPGLFIPKHVFGWMEANWGSVAGFMQFGFGFCTVHSTVQGNRLVSWSLADCIAGDACEIGIHTDEAYRRRGLATLTASAAVEHALSRGLATVGWHCNKDNLGSQGVAEKVGFVKERDYFDYLVITDKVEHLAAHGWYSFRDRDYRQAIAWFEQALATGKPPNWVHHTAARAWAVLGNRKAALDYLEQALDVGWTHVEFTKQCEEFAPLHGTERWNDLLARMNG